MYDKFTAEKCFDKIDFLFQKYGLIPAVFGSLGEFKNVRNRLDEL